jgi:hypothetical protein
MSELQQSLNSIGVSQYLLVVAFVICYALVLGDFLGAGARIGLALVGLVCAVGFASMADYWVHGVLLTVFVLVGMGLFIGLAWGLKTAVLGWQNRARRAASQAHLAANEFKHSASALPDEHAAVEHARG